MAEKDLIREVVGELEGARRAERDVIAYLAKAEVGARQEKLWNAQGTWPSDPKDKEQAPHGRPIDYWVPLVGGQTVGWQGTSGWPTQAKALEIAGKFRQKCIEYMAEHGDKPDKLDKT